MAKIYEALQRAEKERNKKKGGAAAPKESVDWGSPEESSRSRKRSVLARLSALFRAILPSPPDQSNKRRVTLLQPESYAAEQFRTLRARIESLATQRPINSVAVVSANSGDGKTIAAINLAVVTSMSLDRRVLLIDCDLRRPSVHQALGLEPRAGLGEVLGGQAELAEVVMPVDGQRLEILGVRSLPANPSELLASRHMTSLMEEVCQRYDRVILDTPAALGLPDAKIIAEQCDGLILVMRAGVTPVKDVLATLELLDRRRVLGVTLNDADVKPEGYRYA